MTASGPSRPTGGFPLWAWSAVAFAGLAPFFFATYNLANWFTSLRPNVPSLVFRWEHHIPFLAWTIVPYWSTDFFYAASLFLCRTRAELWTHCNRLLATQALCIAGFLLFPLRFSFARPQVSGLFGWMFDSLTSFDRPFNQAPSLHVALTAVLWPVYYRRSRGWMRWVIGAWFILMALSTITTYQHHFIDLPTGLWVGLVSVVLIREARVERAAQSVSARDPLRFLLAPLYLAGSLLLFTIAVFVSGAAWLLFWPAGSLLIVSVIYWTGRPDLVGKSEGAIPAAMLVLLAPYVAAAWLSSRWQTRNQAPAQEISDGVWLGRAPGRNERDHLKIASLVDLTAELPIDTRGVTYCGIPMLDLLAPSINQLEAAVEAIENPDAPRPTLVFCALGYSRSALAVAAWLVETGRAASAGDAVKYVRARRPWIVLPRAYLSRLEDLARAKVPGN